MEKINYKCKVHSTKLLTKYESKSYLKIFLFYRRVVDTADKHLFAICECLRKFSKKNWKGSNEILGGPGETDSWKKLESENLMSDSL